MSFREYILYAAICQSCGREACYQGHCGYLDGHADKADAVERAEGDWATVDGRILCENCRACGRCGTVGNAFAHSNTIDRPVGGMFLCIACHMGGTPRTPGTWASSRGFPNSEGESHDRPSRRLPRNAD